MTVNEARKLFTALAATLSTLVQAQPVAEKPTLVVGDSWEYSDTAADGKTRSWSRAVAEVPACRGGRKSRRTKGHSKPDPRQARAGDDRSCAAFFTAGVNLWVQPRMK